MVVFTKGAATTGTYVVTIDYDLTFSIFTHTGLVFLFLICRYLWC